MPSKEIWESSVQIVLSSAYCDSLCSTPSIVIPLMSLLFLIKIPRISAHKRNEYGVNWFTLCTASLWVKITRCYSIVNNTRLYIIINGVNPAFG